MSADDSSDQRSDHTPAGVAAGAADAPAPLGTLAAVGARLWTPLVLIDASGALKYVNPAAARLVDHDPVAVVGRMFTDVVHPDDRGRMRDLFDRITHDIPIDGPIPLRICERSGNVRHVEVLATDLLDEPSIGAVMVTIRDLSRRIAADAELQFHATHDEATGLLNRAGVRERADELVRTTEWLSVIFVDVSGLDRINDVHGRDHGDRVLAMLSGRIRATAPDDIVGCVGSGEFVVVAPCTRQSSVPLATRIQDVVADCLTLEGAKCKLSVTIGLTVVRCGHRIIDDAIRDAATAAHFARTRGGETIRIFNAEMRREMHDRMELEVRLAEAVLDDSIGIGFQPIVDLSSGTMSGAEALLRWSPPDGRAVTVAEIVEVAEDIGLIVPIGARMINHVFELAARPAVAANGMVLSVNLSTRQLAAPGLVETVFAGLQRSGADPRSIAFELTETSLMADSVGASRTLARLREMGCSIGIDDFGTGYSSLSRLRDLPIDFVKIDQAFVSELDGSGRMEPVVAAIVGLAKAFGMTTVAEGVETPLQRELVTELGCDFGQGYLFGRAEPADTWMSRLATGDSWVTAFGTV